MNRRQLWLSIAGLILLTVMAYSAALRNGFIWDDDDHFTRNPAMVSVQGLKQIWSSLDVSRYYPLTLTTFWLERRCWGLQPLPYHAVNVALQAISASLLWAVLRRLRFRWAWLAAAIWAIHPVNVETVAWATELKNAQSGFFCLLALWMFLKFEDESRPRDYWLAMVCGIAAMLSKPSTVVLPALLLLCDWWRRGKWTRQDWQRVSPLVIFGIGMSVLTIIEQRGHIETVGPSAWTMVPAQRLLLAGRAVWFYAGTIFWPVNLCFIYPRWDLPVHSIGAWLAPGLLVLVGAVLLRFHRVERLRPLLFGLGWFVIGLLPVLGFFDIFFFQYSYVADHFQHLASMGFIAGIVALCGELLQRWRSAGRLAAAALMLTLGVSTWKQVRVYRDDETLWRETLAKNPKAWLAHNNLGVVLMHSGRVGEAIPHYEQMLQLNPAYAPGHYNLGVCLLSLGKIPEAVTQFERALKIQPAYADAECNLGVIFAQSGRITEAIRHYERAVQINPNLAGAHYNWGLALSQAGQEQAAIGHWEQAVRINPDYAEARNNLGVAFDHTGRQPDAIHQWEQAVRIKPDYIEAHNNLGVIFARTGRIEDAIRHYEQALRINPAYAEAHNNLGAAYEQSGRIPEAVSQYRQALQIRPDFLEPQQGLVRLKAAP